MLSLFLKAKLKFLALKCWSSKIFEACSQHKLKRHHRKYFNIRNTLALHVLDCKDYFHEYLKTMKKLLLNTFDQFSSKTGF